VHQAALGKPLVRLLKRLLEDGSRPGEVLLMMEDLKDMGQNSWDTESDDSMPSIQSVSNSGDDEGRNEDYSFEEDS
jgi:hypothetical protein